MTLRPAILLAFTVGGAAPQDFQAWVKEVAARRHQGVADWWLANVDEDATLERVALVCDPKGETADFLVEKDATHRWDIVFSVDGLTAPSCDTSQPPPATLERRKGPGGILYVQGHRGGYEEKRIGLRGGRWVVLAEAELNDARAGDRRKAIDWEARVKARRGSFPTLERGDNPSYATLLVRDLP